MFCNNFKTKTQYGFPNYLLFIKKQDFVFWFVVNESYQDTNILRYRDNDDQNPHSISAPSITYREMWTEPLHFNQASIARLG